MSDVWSLADIRSHIESKGLNKMELLNVVRSIDRSIFIFNYHVVTAKDALKGIIKDSGPAEIRIMEYVFGVSEDQEEQVYANLMSEAHIISSIHTARSIFDMFSHLVNGLVLNNSIKTHICDIIKIGEKLPKSTLKNEINELLNSYWFKYVSGFINTTKHRNLISHSFTASFVDNIVGARIGSFDYKGENFSEYWANELLAGVIEVKNRLIKCGHSLNQLCIQGIA